MKKIIIFLQLLTGIAFAIFIICLGAVIALNFRPLYSLAVEKYGLEETSGLPYDEIMENFDAMVEYNMTWGDGELTLPTLTMSEGGKIHFSDVRDLFVRVQKLGLICGILTVLGFVVFRREKKLHFAASGWSAILLPVSAGIFIAAAWDRFFVLFHEIFFDNDYWIFDARTDPVIKILPDEYFMWCALVILAVVLAGAAVMLTLYHKAKVKTGQ